MAKCWPKPCPHITSSFSQLQGNSLFSTQQWKARSHNRSTGYTTTQHHIHPIEPSLHVQPALEAIEWTWALLHMKVSGLLSARTAANMIHFDRHTLQFKLTYTFFQLTFVSMLGNRFTTCLMAPSSCFSPRQDGRVVPSAQDYREVQEKFNNNSTNITEFNCID